MVDCDPGVGGRTRRGCGEALSKAPQDHPPLVPKFITSRRVAIEAAGF